MIPKRPLRHVRDETGVDLGQVRVERQHLHGDVDMSIELKRGSGISFVVVGRIGRGSGSNSGSGGTPRAVLRTHTEKVA